MVSNPTAAPILFDRALLRARMERARRGGPATFLLDRVREDMEERLQAVMRNFADVADYASERDLVRRWTGGGVVFHGEDLTYAVVIPPSDPVFSESSRSIYAAIHAALCSALAANGECAELAPAAGVVDAGAAIIDRGHSCFANPVRADVMIDGRKIAGAAQRRTRRGLLQQGSIQYVDLGDGLSERFAQALSANCSEVEINRETLDRARELAEQKYGAAAWLRKR